MDQAFIDSSVRQNKAFKQRIAYWQAKGFQPEEAYRRACIKNQLLSLAPAPLAEDMQPKTCRAKNLVGSVDGTNAGIAGNLPGTVQDRGGALTSASSESAVAAINFQGRTETCRPEDLPRTCMASAAVCLAACAMVVLGASTLLIQSSAAVFGTTWDGWLKAILLEMGILGLSIYRPAAIGDFLVARLGAIALAVLSLLVLHAGLTNSESRALASVESSNENLQNIRDERSRLVQMLDALPAQLVTRRQAVLQQVRETSQKLEEQRIHAVQSSSARSVERACQAEALIRVALMFLNITFTHGLMRKLGQLPELGPTPAHSTGRMVSYRSNGGAV